MSKLTREQRIEEVSGTCGWFTGPGYLRKAMELPQTAEEVIALLKVIGVQVDIEYRKIDEGITQQVFAFTNQKGLKRRLSVETKPPWDDPWVVVAAVLFVQLYHGPDSGF